jgi:hypothetical protein
MLPVFAVLLVATGFVRDRYVVQQQVLLHARQCAWQYAIDGCTGEPPPGCEGPSESDADSGANADALLATTKAQTSNGGLDVLDKVPLLGDALREMFGSRTGFTSQKAIRIPWLKNTSTRLSATRVMSCNTRPLSGMTVAKSVLCQLVPGC